MKHFLRLAALLACLIAPSAADAAARFLVACTTACTWDNSSTLIWSTTSGGAPGSAAPVAGDAVTLDANSCVGGVTCIITVNANLAMTSLTMGACTASTAGCILDFSANNNTVALVNFSGTGTGTRTLNMGSGTWTFTNTGSAIVWDMTTITNLTFNAGSSTISILGTPTLARTFIANTLTYGTVSIGATTNGVNFSIQTGSPTFGTLNITAPNVVTFPTTTVTITNAFNWTGSAFNSAIYIASSNAVTVAPISVGANSTIVWAALARITFSGAGTVTTTNSLNLGGNTNANITGPSGGSGGRIIGG